MSTQHVNALKTSGGTSVLLIACVVTPRWRRAALALAPGRGFNVQVIQSYFWSIIFLNLTFLPREMSFSEVPRVTFNHLDPLQEGHTGCKWL